MSDSSHENEVSGNMSDVEGADAEFGAGAEDDIKPNVNADDKLKALKRARLQKRLSGMRNKVLRGAQWATLKKEKRKVWHFFITITHVEPGQVLMSVHEMFRLIHSLFHVFILSLTD